MSSENSSITLVLGVMAGIAVAAAAGVGAWFWFRAEPPPVAIAGPTPPPPAPKTIPVPKVRFTDVTKSAGINFTHVSGQTAMKLLPETMGAGVIVIDYDDDGKPDLLFPNSCPWPGKGDDKAGRPTPKLYRNLGGGRFQDVTAKAGPFDAEGKVASFFGMGGTVGDFDNDHFPDLFLTGVGGNHLYHNEPIDPADAGKGRCLREVTEHAGVGGPGGWPAKVPADFFKHDKPICFSSSAAFLDYDGDGLLDLFVCNYVTWSPEQDARFGFNVDGKERTYGQPTKFTGALCLLYRNKGDGTFEDVSRAAGIEVLEPEGVEPSAPLRPVGKSLGVIVCDPDDDGWPDIVVANDTVKNFFFHNVAKDGKRAFVEEGFPAGIAFAQGRARGAMGIDWAPWYRGKMNSLLIGNFADEPNTFLCQDDPEHLQFADVAIAEGIAGPSRTPLKFGVMFLDYDLDGRLDFLTCNGHLDPAIEEIQGGQKYAQRPQLYWHTGEKGRQFELVTDADAGPDLFVPLVGRGCAYLDIDGDGDLDVVLTANGGPARVLRNDNELGHHWVRLKLVGDGKRSNTSAIGAVVTLEAGGQAQRRQVAAARGYLSQSELVVTFGLGKTKKIDKVTIHWPGKNGGEEVIAGDKIEVDKEQRIVQGKAR